DLYGALDIAYGKLLERLRRARDRRKDHRRGRNRAHQISGESLRTMVPDGEPPAALQDPPPAAAEDSTTDTKADDVTENDVAYDGSPVVIREKKHPASPMTVDDALYRMEMGGHDFFLFIDSETSNPRVVYRRKGWNYGAIGLEQEPAAGRPSRDDGRGVLGTHPARRHVGRRGEAAHHAPTLSWAQARRIALRSQGTGPARCSGAPGARASRLALERTLARTWLLQIASV